MDGIVVVLKPPGMTSSNAVYDVRRIFAEKRAGHLGTLDPGAAGVLPICLGRATKLFDLLVDKEKEYIFEIAFGAETDTQDAYGRVVARGEAAVDEAALRAVLPRFTGRIEQTAPVYSALKVGGMKMYDLARAGKPVAPRVRGINVSSIELLRRIAHNRYLLRVVCSRGTYVRTLCHDIGRALGTCAHLSFLLRTRSGPFTLERAYSVSELASRAQDAALTATVFSCESALSFLPEVRLGAERRTPAINALDTNVRMPNGTVRLYADGFLGVGEVQENRVKLAVHLY